MKFNFQYHGASFNADLDKQENNRVVVILHSPELEKQFGSSFFFYVNNKSVDFDTFNLAHSDLYALNSSISNAIREQCLPAL